MAAYGAGLKDFVPKEIIEDMMKKTNNMRRQTQQ
jgi:hypothetical protein